MCGKKVPHLEKVRIEGAVLNVCDSCAKLGTPAESIRTRYSSPSAHSSNEPIIIPQKKIVVPPSRPSSRRKRRDNIEDLDVVPEYAELIKSAREKLSITQDELASKILEKKNVIASIERGDLLPEIKTARKLERLLNIKLLESEE
jgi:putative transcription factor